MGDVFLDAGEFEGDVIEADVCIAGAGAAGITLARQLADGRRRVLVIESGSFALDVRTQALYDGKSLGWPYHDLDMCRLRFLGGSTNHWGGFCTPFRRRDFSAVPGVENTDWPIGYEELEPYETAAVRALDFDAPDFDPETRLAREGFRFEPAAAHLSETRLLCVVPSNKKRFGERYRSELAAARDLSILLNANVTHIQMRGDRDRVSHLEVQTLGGKRLKAKAEQFVLACHGIENARLLLASNDVREGGVGNAGDMVGRCFADHATIWSGICSVAAGKLPAYLDYETGYGRLFSACLTLPSEVSDKNQCLQYFCRLRPFRVRDEEADAMKHLLRRWDEPFDTAMLDDVVTMLAGVGEVYGRAKRKVGLPATVHYVLDHRIEQAPNRNSRVVLGDARDELGSRRANLDWQLSDVDVRTFQTGQDAVIRYLGAIGAGRVTAPPITEGHLRDKVSSYWHHIGTTRMSRTPATGVVDTDCRVHGVDNLYVAGSSIFCRPTFSPPTMTIMAFARRLADHLKG
jgi:choline dehydrogenase-like flavoprotein